MEGGNKFDEGKIRWELVPPEFEEVVKVLTFGATKYGDRNWEKGMSYGRLIGAAFRHIFAWIRGENLDKETGYHHLSHTLCCLLFLLAYERRNMGEWDDRSITKRSGPTDFESATRGARLQSYTHSSSFNEARQQLAFSY